jgi:hypothetical protein
MCYGGSGSLKQSTTTKHRPPPGLPMISHTGSSRLGYSTHFLALTQHHPTHSQKHRALPRQHSPKHTHINPIGIVTPSMNVRRSLAATRFISSWGGEEVTFICHSGTACHLHTTYTLPEKKRAQTRAGSVVTQSFFV